MMSNAKKTDDKAWKTPNEVNFYLIQIRFVYLFVLLKIKKIISFFVSDNSITTLKTETESTSSTTRTTGL